MSLSPAANAISQLSVEDTDGAPDDNSGVTAISHEDGGGQSQTAVDPDPGATAEAAETTSSNQEPVTDSSQTGPKPKTTCGVCQKEVSKYKCPHCALAYCSVNCSRIHRDSHPPDSLPLSLPAQSTAAAPAGANAPKIAPHPFSVLDESPDLKRLFSKYPSLPSALDRIHATTLPPPKESMRGGLPWTLADAKSIAGGGKKQEPWSRDLGLRRGKNALRKARMDPGEDGDGVREYCELVLHLLATAPAASASNPGLEGSVSDHFTSVVRREAAKDETQLLERLQNEEYAE